MGLSNYLPSSRLIQPGVIANAGERPASPYEGQVIFQKDTNQTLVWDGSAWVMVHDTDQPPGLQLIKTQTIGSAVSSETVSNVFSSEFDSYRIIIWGGSGSTAQTMTLKLGASGTGYYSALVLGTYAATPTLSTVGDSNATVWTYAGASFADSNSMDVTLYGPNLAKPTGITIHTRLDTRTAGSFGMGNGFHNVATAYTDFTIGVSGTMTGGTIRVYGYRNS